MRASRIVSRADAWYFSVAVAVTIIELAVLATTPSLGRFALEYAFIAQLVISISLEFGGAIIIVSWFGVFRSVAIGFWLKASSCCVFYAGIIVAFEYFWGAWLLILSSFVLDSIGTGVLRATFRPAYSALHFDREGRSADFVNALPDSLGIRIGVPCAVLLLAYLVQELTAGKTAIAWFFVLIIACRSYQLILVKKDLSGVARQAKRSIVGDFRVMWSAAALLRKHRGIMIIYVCGGMLDAIVLMYGVGLLYRYREWMSLPEHLSWLGASLVSLSLYLISSIGAAWLALQWTRVQQYFYVVVGVGTVMLSLLTFAMVASVSALFFAGLLGFCLLSSLSSILMTRYASTAILEELSEECSAGIFMWGELLANVFLVIVVGLGIYLGGAENVIRICALGAALLLVFGCVHYARSVRQSAKIED